MTSFPQTPRSVNGKPITPAQHDRLYGGAAIERDEYGLLLFAVESLRNGTAKPVVSLTDAQLAEAEALYTDFRS